MNFSVIGISEMSLGFLDDGDRRRERHCHSGHLVTGRGMRILNNETRIPVPRTHVVVMDLDLTGRGLRWEAVGDGGGTKL